MFSFLSFDHWKKLRLRLSRGYVLFHELVMMLDTTGWILRRSREGKRLDVFSVSILAGNWDLICAVTNGIMMGIGTFGNHTLPGWDEKYLRADLSSLFQ